MFPSSALAARFPALLAADTSSLGAAVALGVHLAKAAFVPALALTVASITQADFDGYAALAAGAAPQQSFVDPVTGGLIVQLNEPAGGWHWQTTGTTSLPMTIYGAYVTDGPGTTLWGSALLASPVTLTASGQGVDVPNVRFTIPAAPCS